MKKSILIIGAGFGQLPAIMKSKEMGLTVITIDRNPEALGVKLADFAYSIDVVDVKGAIKIARKHKIDGVMTMQTDLPVPTVGAVVDSLNLKGSGLEVAERCSNKIKTRIAFKKAGVPQPIFEIVNGLEEAKLAAQKIGYPCIIKSVDSSGSRGVTKVKNESEIESALQEAFKYTRLYEVLVEEYISGKEIGAQGFSVNGKCELVLLHNDTLSVPPYMIPIGHSFPINGFTKDELNQIDNDVKKAVDVLGIKDGPSNIDLIVDSKDNTVKIIEIGARIGATCLPELVYYYSGIDWVEQAIKSSLNLPIDLNLKKKQPVTAFILQAHKDGILSSYEIPNEILNHPNIREVEITAEIGNEVNILRKGTDRIGKIILTADSVEKADELALKLISKISIDVK
jgi:biotin carboxylase